MQLNIMKIKEPVGKAYRFLYYKGGYNISENFDDMRKDLIRQSREEGKHLALIDHALILMRMQHITPGQVLELFQVPKKQRPGLLKTLQACVKQKPEKFNL